MSGLKSYISTQHRYIVNKKQANENIFGKKRFLNRHYKPFAELLRKSNPQYTQRREGFAVRKDNFLSHKKLLHYFYISRIFQKECADEKCE